MVRWATSATLSVVDSLFTRPRCLEVSVINVHALDTKVVLMAQASIVPWVRSDRLDDQVHCQPMRAAFEAHTVWCLLAFQCNRCLVGIQICSWESQSVALEMHTRRWYGASGMQ